MRPIEFDTCIPHHYKMPEYVRDKTIENPSNTNHTVLSNLFFFLIYVDRNNELLYLNYLC